MTVGQKIDARVERAGEALDRVVESFDRDVAVYGKIGPSKGALAALGVLVVFLLLVAVL